MNMFRILLLIFLVSAGFSAEIQKIDPPYDKGAAKVSGIEVSEKLTAAVPMKTYKIINTNKDGRICIGCIKGDTDNFEIVVRDEVGKRVGDYRLAREHNLGIISVPTDGKDLSVVVVRSIDADV